MCVYLGVNNRNILVWMRMRMRNVFFKGILYRIEQLLCRVREISRLLELIELDGFSSVEGLLVETMC